MLGFTVRRRSTARPVLILALALGLTGLTVLVACGEDTGAAGATTDTTGDASGRSAATGRAQLKITRLTEADAGGTFEITVFVHDIGLPDKKGLEIQLEGDDASALRWRFAEKPDALLMEWYAVNGALAFETDGLLGDPARASKTIELRGLAVGEVTAVFELVERDPAARTGEPVKRLEYTFVIQQAPHQTPFEPVPSFYTRL